VRRDATCCRTCCHRCCAFGIAAGENGNVANHEKVIVIPRKEPTRVEAFFTIGVEAFRRTFTSTIGRRIGARVLGVGDGAQAHQTNEDED
jgi:hypothetical protein